MAEPRLRTVNKAVAPFAVNKFPSSFVETLAQNIVYMMATKQSMSLEGNEWEQIFAECVGAEWKPSNVGLDDVVLDNCCWGAKTVFGQTDIEHQDTGKNTQIYQILGIKPVLETMQMLQYNYEWYEAVNNTELDFVISDNPAQTVRNGFNDICIPVSSNKAIIFRIKGKTAPLISKDMPENGVINLSLNSVITYNCMQLAMGQKFLFGTSNTIKYMKKMWEARSAGRNKRK